jgi:hypothetical protein
VFIINGGLLQESDGLAVTLGIAAATGIGALAFSEVESNELFPFVLTFNDTGIWHDSTDILFTILLFL